MLTVYMPAWQQTSSQMVGNVLEYSVNALSSAVALGQVISLLGKGLE